MSDSQKLLLDWHNRFAHLNFARVQKVLRHIPFIANKFGDATNCEPLMCHSCELAKAKRRAKKSSLQTETTERDGALKTGNLKVGARASLDHFEIRLWVELMTPMESPPLPNSREEPFMLTMLQASSIVNTK
jgi:hypothetical protein